jgi:hypothetical protein
VGEGTKGEREGGNSRKGEGRGGEETGGMEGEEKTLTPKFSDRSLPLLDYHKSQPTANSQPCTVTIIISTVASRYSQFHGCVSNFLLNA